MKDYFKKCWSCGGTDMEKKDSYFQCRSCGATWSKPPRIGPVPFEAKRDLATGDTSVSPTPATIARIAKSRALNEEKLRQERAEAALAKTPTSRKRTRASARTS